MIISRIKNLLKDVRDFPKSFYVNIRCLPITQAIKMPIKIKWDTEINHLHKGDIIICSDNISKGMIEIGYRGGKNIPCRRAYIDVVNGGRIVFNGHATLGEGASIYVDYGKLLFGNNIYANRNIQIQCEKKISLGDNVLLGWNVNIRDTDGHATIVNGEKQDFRASINIKSHTWIASDVTILKNSEISTDSIVACGSIVCGLKDKKGGCLIAGTPARIKKEDISWEE